VESKVFRWLANRRHRALREDLSAYIDGRLSPEDKRRLEEHLDACAGCRSELEELRSVVEAMRSLPTVPAPRSFAIEPAAVPRPRPVGAPRASLALGGLSAAALVVFAVILGADLLTRPGAETVRKAAPEAMAPAALEAGEGAQADEANAGGETFAPEEAPAPTVVAPSEAPPAPTVAAPGEATEVPEDRAAEVPTPPATEEEAAPPAEEGGGNGGRTVLLALEVAFGVAFVTALVGAVWLRRRGDVT
jgi:anti-sigma factor RsiW